MNELTCEEVRDLAAELALDALPGDQRAAVLAHLDTCSACRALVDDLSMAADRLLLALPEADVPPMLSTRLHASVPATSAAEATDRGRRWAWFGVAAALAAIVVAGVLTLTIGGDGGRPGSGSFALVTPAGATIGDIAIEGSDDPWVHVTIEQDIPPLGGCILVLDDGSRHEIGAWPVDDEHREWGAPLKQPADRIVRAELVDTGGEPIAVAHVGR